MSPNNRTRHRAYTYLDPANPLAGRGQVVADPPPAGTTRSIDIAEVAEWARNTAGDRIAYRITYRRRLDHPDGTSIPGGPDRDTYITVARQPDGRWLATLHAPQLDPPH